MKALVCGSLRKYCDGFESVYGKWPPLMSSGVYDIPNVQTDIVGVFTVAFIAAFGGGTLRDILLDKRPLFWVQHQEYAILIFVLAVVPFVL